MIEIQKLMKTEQHDNNLWSWGWVKVATVATTLDADVYVSACGKRGDEYAYSQS